MDFTLHCQGLSIPCHRIVLGARSDFFRGLLWWLLPVICISVTDDICSVRNWRKQAGTLLLYKISMWTLFDLCSTTSTWVTLDDCEFSFFNCVNHFSDWSLIIDCGGNAMLEATRREKAAVASTAAAPAAAPAATTVFLESHLIGSEQNVFSFFR